MLNDPEGEQRSLIGTDPSNFQFGKLGAMGPMGGAASAGAIACLINAYSKKSGKEKASDIPSWAKGKQALPGETPSETADRLSKEKSGPDYKTGPGSEYNKIKKYFERK